VKGFGFMVCEPKFKGANFGFRFWIHVKEFGLSIWVLRLELRFQGL
jgi:hypothetical protein